MRSRARVGIGVALTAGLAACGGGDGASKGSGSPTGATWLAEPLTAVRTSGLVAGPHVADAEVTNPFENDESALLDGRKLYEAMNCSGCHGGNGGGGIGPPFADADWIYGGEPANIYASIVQGRPNGMPSFGHAINGDAVWKIAVYVRSLGAKAAAAGAAGRTGGVESRQSVGEGRNQDNVAGGGGNTP